MNKKLYEYDVPGKGGVQYSIGKLV